MRLELRELKPRTGAPSSPDVGSKGKARSRAAAAPGPPVPGGRRDSRPSAAPAGPSSWCPDAPRQVSASQVSGRKWRPAGRGDGVGGAGGGGRQPRARRSVRGHWRLRRAALSGPAGAERSKSGSRAGAGAQRRSARRARPSPGPRPALLLKGPEPVPAPTAPATGAAAPSEDLREGRARGTDGQPTLSVCPSAVPRLLQAVPGPAPAPRGPASRELGRRALRLAGGRESQACRREEGRSGCRSWPSRGLRVDAVDARS